MLLFLVLLLALSEAAVICNPFGSNSLVWNTTNGWYSFFLDTVQDSSGFGAVLLAEGYEDKLTRISIPQGKALWYDPETFLHPIVVRYGTTYNNTVYYTTRNAPNVTTRISAFTGQVLSNLTLDVGERTYQYEAAPALACGNVLYSRVGDLFYSLYANDIDTGAHIWHTDYEGILKPTLSANCSHIYFLRDPLENTLNYSVVKIDAATGQTIFDVDTGVPRLGSLFLSAYYLIVSENSQRIALAWSDNGIGGHRFANLLVYSSRTGQLTFELFMGKSSPYYTASVPSFSPNGDLLLYSPREAIGIELIPSGQDRVIWKYNTTYGLVNSDCFSPTGRSVVIVEWNYGTYLYSALDTASGKPYWQSPILGSGYGSESWFTSPSGDVYAFTGPYILKADYKTCPLL